MIATCTNCQARYQLENAKIPSRIIQVRCPACQGVFALDGSMSTVEEPVVDEFSSFEPVAEVKAPEVKETAPAFVAEPEEIQISQPAAVVEPAPVAPIAPVVTASATPQAAAPVEKTSAPSVSAAVATLDEPAPVTSSKRRRRCKEEMLARALVSDILVYNRETRDAGLEEGNLLEALGGEIKKSWELYKEKVTPEVANSTTYFREALNEILADGTQVF